jgi:hypothetical protein
LSWSFFRRRSLAMRFCIRPSVRLAIREFCPIVQQRGRPRGADAPPSSTIHPLEVLLLRAPRTLRNHPSQLSRNARPGVRSQRNSWICAPLTANRLLVKTSGTVVEENLREKVAKNRTRAFTIILLVASNASVASAQPRDPCALLKSAEIQALAPGATIGNGVAAVETLGASCVYTWGPKSDKWGDPQLSVTVLDTSKAYPGMDANTLKQGMLAVVKTGGPNASIIPGIGDAAAFTFEDRVSSATAQAYFAAKGVQVSLTFHSGDALSSKDKLTALLKEAVGRL